MTEPSLDDAGRPSLVFLPWVRRGGPVDLPDDARDGHPANHVSVTAEVKVNGAGPARVPVRLLGPGDVTGVAAQQVIRTDPAPGTRTFEANYFPLVEFDEPALPWLFTPARAVAGALRPWLCLVVVREQPGVRLSAPARGTLPVLRIGAPARPEEELPDLDESWAWAHAQLATDAGTTLTDARVSAELAADPARSLSRLVCGRILAEQTEYLACVVPTFEAGRRAGLGLDGLGLDGSGLDGSEGQDAEGPAWRRAPRMGPVGLPVYHHWRFATGPAGDFQSLALAIRGRPVADGFGTRPVDLSTSGLGIPGTEDAQLRLAGALLALETPVPRWSDPELAQSFATALDGVLNAPDQAPAANPLLAPPRYGSVYRTVADSGSANPMTLDPAQPGRWYEQLNRDPAHRVAAALGTLVVQQQQETLVAAAWDQAADLHTAGRVFGLAALGLALADSLHRRHVAPLPPETGLFVLAPLRARLLQAPSTGTGSMSFGQRWTESRLPDQALSPVVRRVTRPRGPAVRRAGAAGSGGSGGGSSGPIDVLDKMAPISWKGRLLTPAGGPLTFEAGGAALPVPQNLSWAQVTAQAVENTQPRPAFRFGPTPLLTTSLLARAEATTEPIPPAERRRPDPDDPTDPFPTDPDEPDEPTEPDPTDPDRPHPRLEDSADAAAFRVAAKQQLAAFLATGLPEAPPLGGVAAEDLFAEARALTAPQRTFSARVAGLLTAPPSQETSGAVPPLRFSPRFDTPMSRSLVELGQHWLLPGIDGVPADTALGLRTNSEFVEAFMVGLNHELGRELLWREFPTPMTATFFDRFWDAGVAPDAPPDLAPLETWSDRSLGGPVGGGATIGGDRFVLLLRSELIKRFPDAVVSAVKPGTHGAPAEQLLPVFRGSLEPDISFFGFTVPLAQANDWSIVIAEQPGAPRFGFEIGELPGGTTGGGTHAPATEATSARQASRLRQLPARITIPVSVLMRRPTP